jgi:hypothetical protein
LTTPILKVNDKGSNRQRDKDAIIKINNFWNTNAVPLTVLQQTKKPYKLVIYMALSFYSVVWGGIEPPTQGFSVLCSTN